ncbi:MAG TPA: hypothetical protein VI363_05425 [Burkholderiales bacterium]
MENEKLSAREAALIDEARRDVEARKGGAPAEKALQAPLPVARQPQAPDSPKPGPAERLAQLIAEERAETARKKKKMRRYGLTISISILVVFALFLLRAFSRRR